MGSTTIVESNGYKVCSVGRCSVQWLGEADEGVCLYGYVFSRVKYTPNSVSSHPKWCEFILSLMLNYLLSSVDSNNIYYQHFIKKRLVNVLCLNPRSH